MCLLTLYFRGPEFRKDYSRLSEIRSIVHKLTNVMALTATASPAMKQAIMDSLSMPVSDTLVIEKIPNRVNIRYDVCSAPKDVSEILSPVVAAIKACGIRARKTIIFCRTYTDFNEISTAIINALHVAGLLMPEEGSQHVCQMFSASTEEKVKNDVLLSFIDPQSALRIVVATIAFGMGLNAPNVGRIIHYGPSDTIEAYIQETGRCGRDGCDSLATLFYRKRDIAGNSLVSDEMKHYCRNTGFCRRKLLMQVFNSTDEIEIPSPVHRCCDVCEKECLCTTCSTASPVPVFEDNPCALSETTHACDCEPLSRQQQNTLQQLLLVYRDGQCKGSDKLLFGKEIASGIPNSIISALVKNAHVISSPQCIADAGVSSPVQCHQMYDILQSMF